MGLVSELRQEILTHLQTEREEVGLTCSECQAQWDITGPFKSRHPFACPACGKSGIINLEQQADRILGDVLEQLDPQASEPKSHQHNGSCC